MKIEFILFCVYIYITRTIECAAVEAPLDIITLDDLTPLERAHLQYLRDASSRKKRSGLLSSIGQGLKSKIGLLAQGSASAVSHFSAGSSGHHHAPHHDVPETYDHKSFDFWALKKSILNTLLQAAKAIKGGVIALKGQLIKGSGYLVSAKGKLISSQGEAITNLGKNIASSALLSPHHGHSHSSGYAASGPSYEPPHGEYGPPSDHDVEYAAPSAPSPEYGLPDHHGPSDIYQPQKYPSHYDEKHKTLHGYPQGILILKKIQSERHEDTQESKIPKFKPLKEQPPAPTFNSFITTLFGSSSHQTSDLHKPPPPPPTADSHYDTPYHDSQPRYQQPYIGYNPYYKS